jgi:peptide/nickel transport system ATP-binding protein
MYLGKICEVGAPQELFERPLHPYTELLISSVPKPDPHAERIPFEASGEMPSPIDPPTGCRFRTRCPNATDLCATTEPQLTEVVPGRHVACHFPLT